MGRRVGARGRAGGRGRDVHGHCWPAVRRSSLGRAASMAELKTADKSRTKLINCRSIRSWSIC
jgi:hypothetical protein